MRKNGFELGLIPHNRLTNLILRWSLDILPRLTLNSWVQVNHSFQRSWGYRQIRGNQEQLWGGWVSTSNTVFTVMVPAPKGRLVHEGKGRWPMDTGVEALWVGRVRGLAEADQLYLRWFNACIALGGILGITGATWTGSYRKKGSGTCNLRVCDILQVEMCRDFLNSPDRVREGEAQLIKGILHYALSSEGCPVNGRLWPDLAEFSHIFTKHVKAGCWYTWCL